VPTDKIISEQLITRTNPELSLEERVVGGIIDQKYLVVLEILKDSNESLFLKIQPQKGSNIIIQCENLNDLRTIIERIQLNIEKELVDSGEYIIETTDVKRVEIDGLISYKRKDQSILEEIEYKEKEKEKLIKRISNPESDVKEADELFILHDEIEELKNKVGTYVISSIDEISINGRKLEETDKVADYLIEKAKISQNEEEKIIDFNLQGYGDEVQTCLMKYLYTKEISLTDKQKEALTYYKGAGFVKTNAFTRGNFDELEKKYDSPKTVENMVEKLLIIEEIAKGLPKRKYDIVLSRKGKGVGKSTEIGSENEYNSLVSFGTNEGTDMGNKSNTIYKRVLNKEEPCVPADFLLSDAVFIDRTECEIITLPFSYKVEDYKKEENSRYQYITMGDIKEISLIDLIENRLNGLNEYQKSKLEKIYESEKKLQEKTNSERENDLKELGYKENEATEEQIELTDVFKEMSKDKLSEIIETDKKILRDENHYQSETHGVNHVRRVAFFGGLLADLGNLSKKDKEILLTAIRYHDIGRENDGEDSEHGKKSVQKLENIKGYQRLPDEDKQLIRFMIEQHSIEGKENDKAILELDEGKRERYKMMLDYIKDADKLDRVRLGGYDGLDSSRLALPESKKIIKLAYQSYECLFNMIQVSEKEKVEQILEDTNNALQKIREIKENTIAEKREDNKIKSLDERKIVNSDELLGKIIEESKEQGCLSKIKGFAAEIKRRIKETLGLDKEAEKGDNNDGR